MRIRIIRLSVLLLFMLLACRLPAVLAPFSGITPTPSDLVNTRVAATVTASEATATPPPASPSPTASPTPSLTLSPTPSPTLTPTLNPTDAPLGNLPLPAVPIGQPAGEVTILLLGSDQRPGASDFRTDTMVLLVLKSDGTVNLVSFPRDLWVYLPGHFMQRINTAQEYGGFELLQSTFQYNFGFTPQSYVLTNFSGFQSVIDTLGGIEVQVGQDFSDARTGYPKGYKIKAGLVHMDGATALWYIRARMTSSDLDRLRRGQEVIFAIGRKLLSLYGLAHIPKVYAQFSQAFVTNLTVEAVVNLLPVLQKVDPNQLQSYTIGAGQVNRFITSNGADVLLPKPDAIRQVLIQALK